MSGGLNPLTIILGPLATLRQWMFPALVALVFGGRSSGGPSLWVIVPILIVVTVAARVVTVLRTKWTVDHAGLTLRTGLLNLETRSIPHDRIQNVDLVQPLIPRLLGLAEVKVETAGAAGADVSLAYLSLETAHAIRSRLVGRSEGERWEDGPPDTAARPDGLPPLPPLVATGVRELVIAGATSNRAGALAVAAGVVLQYADDLGLDIGSYLEEAVGTAAGQTTMRLVVGSLVLIIAALVVGWIVSIFESVVRFHGFRLARRGGDLHRDFGLFARTSASFPLARVQSVRIERTWLRRLLGFASVWADTAGSVLEEASGGVVAPLVQDGDVPQLIDEILPSGWRGDEALESVSRVAIRRGMVRAAVPVVIVAAALVPLRPGAAAAVLAVGLLGAWWYAVRRYAGLGYLVGDRYLHARSGVMTERRWVVPRHKVQAVSVTASYFQRRLGVATVHAHTAGTASSRIPIVDLDRDLAGRLADRLSERSAATAFASDGV